MTSFPASTDLLALFAAVPAAALGGASFLKGVLGVAAWMRLPRILVATTLAAFATSSPEMVVSTLAALGSKPEIGLGDALGSNVVNVALILGASLLFGPVAVAGTVLRRDFALALLVPLLTLVLALDGSLSRLDGALLLALFAAWSTLVVRQALTHRREVIDAGGPHVGATRAWLLLLAGLAALVLAGQLFVAGASGIAASLGVHPYLVGATVVAIGTSLPELVTVLLSRWQGHDDVGLGTLLGSNLFNGLAIVGVAASIHPIRAPLGEVAAALLSGALAVLITIPRKGAISRSHGLWLLAVYAGFVLFTVSVVR